MVTLVWIFQQQVTLSHTHCWKSANRKGIPGRPRNIPTYNCAVLFLKTQIYSLFIYTSKYVFAQATITTGKMYFLISSKSNTFRTLFSLEKHKIQYKISGSRPRTSKSTLVYNQLPLSLLSNNLENLYIPKYYHS